MIPSFHFLDRFREAVLRYPKKGAIVHGEEEITYENLWKKASLLAKQLLQQTDGEQLIALSSDEGIKSYVYLLAIWLSGKAYVPISKSWSDSKIQQVVAAGNVKTIIGQDERTGAFFEKVIENQPEQREIENVKIDQSSDTAYVLFTSGSTGIPKGVVISKENLNAFHHHYLDSKTYEFSEQDRFLQSYDLTFDVSVFCFTLPLMLGATLYLPEEKGIKFINILGALKKHNITVTSNVPSLLRYSYKKLEGANFPSLRYSFFSGEALQGNWAKKWMKACPNAQVYNCYGPTETTIVCTSELLNTLEESYFETENPLPLGEPFEGMDLKLFENEICFAGEQVFSEYLNGKKPELFVYQKSWYPTGDRAYYDENKKLIFLGRNDQQVQIDGYRVELEEVAGVVKKLTNSPSIAFLLHKTDQPVLAVAVESNFKEAEYELRQKCEEFLPLYTVPKHFFWIESFPLNQNGKVNLQELKKLVELNLR